MAQKKESKAKRLGSVTKRAHSLDEIAVAVGLSIAGVRREVQAGHLEVLHVGRRVIVLEEKLQSWLDSKALPQIA